MKRLQEIAGLTLQIQKLDRMKWGVVADASWANTVGSKSQGGRVIITFNEKLMQGKQAKTNVLIWKSGKLVGSTLAAETQSLARGVCEMIWPQVVYLEITEPSFNVHDWQHQVPERGYLALASEESQETLQQALAVVDAKSLYDIASKDTHGDQDRRTSTCSGSRKSREPFKACEMEHRDMIADGLTKNGSLEALLRVLAYGVCGIEAESSVLHRRAAERDSGVRDCGEL